MSAHRLGRGFADLPIEERVRALRDHAIGQELLIRIALAAVQKLGVDFIWPGDKDRPEDVEQGVSNPDAGA